jgi:hypothetical protein
VVFSPSSQAAYFSRCRVASCAGKLKSSSCFRRKWMHILIQLVFLRSQLSPVCFCAEQHPGLPLHQRLKRFSGSGPFAGIALACRCRSNGARILTSSVVGRTGQNTVTTPILGLSRKHASLKGPERIHGCDCLPLPSRPSPENNSIALTVRYTGFRCSSRRIMRP